MTSLSVVEDLNPLDNRDFCWLRGHSGCAIHPFGFQSAEEAFSNRIIPTISPSAHAAGHPSLDQSLLLGAAGILSALARMEEQSCWGWSLLA